MRDQVLKQGVAEVDNVDKQRYRDAKRRNDDIHEEEEEQFDAEEEYQEINEV